MISKRKKDAARFGSADKCKGSSRPSE